MAKFCGKAIGDYPFYLKTYTLVASSKFARFKTAQDVYGSGMGLLKQADIAAQWCSAHTDLVGFVISADAVAGHEEVWPLHGSVYHSPNGL